MVFKMPQLLVLILPNIIMTGNLKCLNAKILFMKLNLNTFYIQV